MQEQAVETVKDILFTFSIIIFYLKENKDLQIQSLTYWEEILSQLGEVLLYGSADADIPFLKLQTNIDTPLETKKKKKKLLKVQRCR